MSIEIFIFNLLNLKKKTANEKKTALRERVQVGKTVTSGKIFKANAQVTSHNFYYSQSTKLIISQTNKKTNNKF